MILSMRKTVVGLDVLMQEKISLLKGKRVGLLCHAASLSHDYHHAHTLFYNHPDVNLVRLFAPEHGLYAVAQDMEHVADERDMATQIPVTSLYGSTFETLTPTNASLHDIDIFVVDLQDIGSRYYTFIYTMALCLKKCGELNIPVLILDRPNPLGGNHVEGNLLDPVCASFVGLYPLPVCHGMTMGELALYFNDTQNFNATVDIIKMKNWCREQIFVETGLEFIAPSPNMPTPHTVRVYPGQCLFEATELSEGRGTTRPFEWCGHPKVHAEKLAQHLNAISLKGVTFVPHYFKPSFQKHKDQVCGGLTHVITDSQTYRSYETSLRLLYEFKKHLGDDFVWRQKPYEFVDKIPAIDLLCGYRQATEFFTSEQCERPYSQTLLAQWVETFHDSESHFRNIRQPYLIYS